MNPWKSNQLHKQQKCKYTEAVTGGVFCKLKCSLKFCKARRKTPVRVSFLIMLQTEACNFIKKETLAHVFSCEFCEISKNSFSYRIPLVAASGVKTRVSYEIMTMKRQLKIFRAKWRALLWVLWTVPVEILRRIQRFRKGAVLCVGHHGWPILKKILEENFRFQMV